MVIFITDTVNMTTKFGPPVPVQSLGSSLKKRLLFFQLKSCDPWQIDFLSEGLTTYYIHIGYKQSDINYNSPTGSSVSTYNASFFGCDSFKDFWVNWNHGMIGVGQGDILGVNMFLSFNPGTLIPVVNGVKIASYSLATEPVEWIFQIDKVCMIIFVIL